MEKRELRLVDEEMQRIGEGIIRYLRLRMVELSRNGAALALSGGIDSAALALIARKAFSQALTLLMMPEEGVTSEGDILNAEEVASLVAIPLTIVPISDLIYAFTKKSPTQFSRDHLRTGSEFLKARIRAALLYFHAEAQNYLVLGSLTKTDFLLGYGIKFGDAAADIFPFGNLYKTQVLQLASYLGLPRRIIVKPPSQGLISGQEDEKTIGLRYSALDALLFEVYERQRTVDEVCNHLQIPLSKAVEILRRAELNRSLLSTLEMCPLEFV